MAIRNFEVNCIFFSTMCYGSFFSWGIWCYGRQGMGYCDRFYFFCIVLCMNTNIFSTLPLDVENIGIYTQNIKDASSQTMRSLLTFASLRQSARAFHAQCSLFSGAESSLPSLRSDNPHALKTHNARINKKSRQEVNFRRDFYLSWRSAPDFYRDHSIIVATAPEPTV